VKYLIATNAWIGFWEGDKKFGLIAKPIMVDSPGECVISMASIWEASIKIGLGKLKLPYDLRSDLPRLLDDNGLSLLDIDMDDALSVVDLP
jgi:PIN domain nuclease of toxin-antitoxin system